MSNNNGIISKPIDVRRDIAYVLGVDIGDVGELCTSIEIKPYAKYKPVDIDSIETPTDAQRKAINYGITAPVASSTPAETKNTLWKYTKPTKKFRVLDFDGYNHKAVAPIVTKGNIVVKQSDSSGVTLATFPNVVGSMTLSDFGSLDGYYLAVLMIGSTNNLPYIKTASAPFGSTMAPTLRLTYSELTPFNSGTEYYLCLSDTMQTTFGQLPAGAKYLPIPRFQGQTLDDFIGTVTKQAGYNVRATFDMLFPRTAPASATQFTNPAPPKPNYFSALPPPDPETGEIPNESRYYYTTTTNTSLNIRFQLTQMDDTIYGNSLYARLSPTYYGTPSARNKMTIYRLVNGTVTEVTGALSTGVTYVAALPASALVMNSSNVPGGAIPSTLMKIRPTLYIYDGAGESSVLITSVSFGVTNQ